MATVRETLQKTTQALARSGVDNAALDARLIVMRVVGVTLERLMIEGSAQVNRGQEQAIEKAIMMRAVDRIPVSRILGKREFWSMEFKVTPAVLDPRPDSETLIEAALGAVANRGANLRVLDLGTGSGCLLLSLLKELRNAVGTGVDSSEPALEVARANAAALGLDRRVKMIAGDWGKDAGLGWDIVVSNPPYIPTATIDTLDPEVRMHDPRAALDGGPDGLTAYRRIVPDLPTLVVPGGFAALEVGQGQAEEVAEMMRKVGLSDISTRPDLNGIDRVVLARRA